MPSIHRWEAPRVAQRAGRLIVFATVFAAASTALSAQQPASRDTAAATRSQLEAQATQLEASAQTASDAKVRAADQQQAASIRQRLRDGDFQVGDRIALIVRGDSTLNDTAVVRSGRVIELKNIPPISLQGVLHSELQSYLTKQLAQYLKNPTVQVTPLLQIAVVGSVGHPGFFWVPADLTLTDAITLAGGPTQASDLNGTTIVRDKKDWLSSDQVQRAFASGTTLDQLDVRAGDQISVPVQGKHDWLRVAQIAAVLAGLTVSIIALSRH